LTGTRSERLSPVDERRTVYRMPTGDVETYHADGTWHNRVQGTGQQLGERATKDEAVAIGRREAQSRKVEHIIKNLDGSIAERNSYGNDPRNTPG
jgi:hypothetical protein